MTNPIIIYRPQLMNPARRAAIAFSDGFDIHVHLEPGENRNFSDQQIEFLKTNKDFAKYQEWKAIEVIQAPEASPAITPDYLDLSALSEDDAKKVIDSCTNAQTLGRWLSVENRKTVQPAIRRRVEAINKGLV